mgnify:CR=1 FL=1
MDGRAVAAVAGYDEMAGALLSPDAWPPDVFDTRLLSLVRARELGRLACTCRALSDVARHPLSWRALCEATWPGRTNERCFAGNWRSLFRWHNGWGAPALRFEARSVAPPDRSYVSAFLLEQGGESLLIASDSHVHELNVAAGSTEREIQTGRPVPSSHQTVYSIATIGSSAYALGAASAEGGVVSIHQRSMGGCSASSISVELTSAAGDERDGTLPACVQLIGNAGDSNRLAALYDASTTTAPVFLAAFNNTALVENGAARSCVRLWDVTSQRCVSQLCDPLDRYGLIAMDMAPPSSIHTNRLCAQSVSKEAGSPHLLCALSCPAGSCRSLSLIHI